MMGCKGEGEFLGGIYCLGGKNGLLAVLLQGLTSSFGKGFTERNIRFIRAYFTTKYLPIDKEIVRKIGDWRAVGVVIEKSK